MYYLVTNILISLKQKPLLKENNVVHKQKIIVTNRIKVKLARLVHIWLILVFVNTYVVILQILHI